MQAHHQNTKPSTNLSLTFMNVGICTYNIKQTKKLLFGANHDQLDG